MINGLVSQRCAEGLEPGRAERQRQRDLRRGEQSRCGGSKIFKGGQGGEQKVAAYSKVLWTQRNAGAHALGGAGPQRA